MNVWLINVGEPLPIDTGSDRALRMGMLAEALNQQGHHVLWWASEYDHNRKQHRVATDTEVQVNPRLAMRLLHSIGYQKNISLRRMANHVGIARKFKQIAPTQPKPDVIVCALPTLELCVEATRYGRRYDVPVILDIRDLWPDLFLDLFPSPLQIPARVALAPMYRMAREACSTATAFIGTTNEYVRWALQYAGRQATAWDREFPMAYRVTPPCEEELRSAREFWTQKGLDRGDESFVACFIGTIGRNFEIDCVVEAARKVRKAGRSVNWVICGGGDLERYRQAAADCSNIIFPGWINSPQIWTLMQMSKIGLAPYVSNKNFINNLPNKPVEYLSAGLPIVSSLKGVLARLLEQEGCGLTYPNQDSQSLAKVITELHDNPGECERMSYNASKVFRDRFVADKVFGDLGMYLEEVVKSRSLRHAV